MLVSEPGPDLLREERELIRQEPDERKRADLLALAVTIATRYFDKAFLWRFFREELEQMREATFVEDWIQEGIEQGLQEGLQQGRMESRRTQRENILQVLRVRFRLSQQGEKPLADQLETIDDLDALRDLFNHALLDVTLTDFSTQLERAADGR
jgi:predicted transposase YdaD